MILTPQFQATKLSKTLGINVPVYIKREDLHPLGSHKGRSIPIMIEKYFEKGIKKFVISSSGNAALAAVKTVNQHNAKHPENLIKLQVLVGKKIPKHKLQFITNEIKDKNIDFEQIDNPKQTAFQIDKEGKMKFLRQSTDEFALKGYDELAKELTAVKELGAVFIPTSSGTCAQGLFEAFKNYSVNPQIHIIQTNSCHPIVEELYEKIKDNKEPSLASAIVDNIAHRKQDILNVIKNSHGFGWIAENTEIREAIKLIKQTTNLEISPNSALAVVGFIKALQNNWKFEGPVVLLFTGN